MRFQKLKRIVEQQDTTAGKVFDLFLQTLIVLSLFAFSLETIPELSIYEDWFFRIEEFVVTIFTLEYITRLIVADKKLKFVFSLGGIVDLLAIAPFYISKGIIDLRIIRIFRLMRVFRVLKLLRYSRAVRRFVHAFNSIKEELIVFFIATVFILYLASAGIYFFEHDAQPEQFKSIFHSMWWALATLTTVGYGDIYPVTFGGKLFTFVVLLIGLGVVSVPSALLASALAHKDSLDIKSLSKDKRHPIVNKKD